MKPITAILISLGGLVAVIAVDVWLALTKRQTISQWARRYSIYLHWLSFLAGYMLCHWFGWF